VREALERVGLGHRLEHKPAELSGGEQQRVSIARALVNRPSLLLADEPTGNLDSHTGEDILNLIRDLRLALGMTVVMVTHERALAERFAQRLIFLADGKVISSTAVGAPSFSPLGERMGPAETPKQGSAGAEEVRA
jgi:predicted ABC-type transport system involved in lysophospholipase L1 biosynthesis ATPase subunit